MFVVDRKIDQKLLVNFKDNACDVVSEKTESFKRFCHQEIKFGVFLANIAPFCIEIFKFSFYVVTFIQIIINMQSNEFEMNNFENGNSMDMPEYNITFRVGNGWFFFKKT